MMEIRGVSKDEPIVENERGGRQAATPYAFHLMDANAMFALAKVLAEGEVKYTRDNWRKINREDHLNHATQHIFAYLAGDTQDSHLEHAFTRLMMALATSDEPTEGKTLLALTDAEIPAIRNAKEILKQADIYMTGGVGTAPMRKSIHDSLTSLTAILAKRNE